MLTLIEVVYDLAGEICTNKRAFFRDLLRSWWKSIKLLQDETFDNLKMFF